MVSAVGRISISWSDVWSIEVLKSSDSGLASALLRTVSGTTPVHTTNTQQTPTHHCTKKGLSNSILHPDPSDWKVLIGSEGPASNPTPHAKISSTNTPQFHLILLEARSAAGSSTTCTSGDSICSSQQQLAKTVFPLGTLNCVCHGIN